MIGKVNTGNAAIPYAVIWVEYDPSALCTCSDGVTTLVAKGDTGTFLFKIPHNGAWRVTSIKDGFSKYFDVEITHKYQAEKVYLPSQGYIYNEGKWGYLAPDGMTNNVISGTAGWNGRDCVFNPTNIEYSLSGNYINGIRTQFKVEFSRNFFTTLHIVLSSYTSNTNGNGGCLFGISDETSMSNVEKISRIKNKMLAYSDITTTGDLELSIPNTVESAYVYIVNMSSKTTTTKIYAQ